MAGKATEFELLRRLIQDLPLADTAARQLLDRLDGLHAILSANREQIAQIAGAAIATRIGDVGALYDHIVTSAIAERPLLDSTLALADYLRVTMAGLGAEEVRVLYLDVKSNLIRAETVSRGSLSNAPIVPREIVRRALELSARSIILAHNHPSGDATPSTEDIAATRRMIEAAEVFDLVVLDHFVVGRRGWTSCRAAGLMR